ncbi:MAG: alpha-glucosidase [Oscillospiraceae bacterium]|nr:alpha-glucosidase [Oscillospiraceae bacterium]
MRSWICFCKEFFMLRVEAQNDALTVYLADRPVLTHTPDSPFVIAGQGAGAFHAHGGHWRISDRLSRRTMLTNAHYDAGRSSIRFWGGDLSLTFHLSEADGNLVLTPQRSTTGLNRLWLQFPATPGHCVYGGGAQYGLLDLRGHRLPLWVHERRIGRESARLPFRPGSGRHATYHPQPTFVTQDGIFVHIDAPVYGALDFRAPRHHRVELWDLPAAVIVGVAADVPALMERLTRLLGRQPVLPQWCVEGAWIETQGGAARLIERLERVLAAGARVSAVCVRDWSGLRETGRRWQVFFDWVWNRELYPKLDKMIGEFGVRGLHTLAYINPHLSIEGRLFAEASLSGFLVRKPESGNFINDMGGFMAGHLDLSNPDACAWYKEIIKKNILQFGFSGYMADMGYFLPARAVLANRESSNRMHNRWPMLWAKLNREAVREAGRTADAVFFTRAGYGAMGGQTMLASTGDHNTGWGAEDGLPSALDAALTLACGGIGLSLSDVGGNVSFAARRTKELLLRWTEYAAFTPIMRMADMGGAQLEFDADEETLSVFARLTRVHAALAPYMRALIRENAHTGLPVMRPMWMVFPDDDRLRRVHHSYMLGEEMLVSPVLRRGRRSQTLLLPAGHWLHMWTKQVHSGGEHTVSAPLGYPPVFYRPDGQWADLFAAIGQKGDDSSVCF